MALTELKQYTSKAFSYPLETKTWQRIISQLVIIIFALQLAHDLIGTVPDSFLPAEAKFSIFLAIPFIMNAQLFGYSLHQIKYIQEKRWKLSQVKKDWWDYFFNGLLLALISWVVLFVINMLLSYLAQQDLGWRGAIGVQVLIYFLLWQLFLPWLAVVARLKDLTQLRSFWQAYKIWWRNKSKVLVAVVALGLYYGLVQVTFFGYSWLVSHIDIAWLVTGIHLIIFNGLQAITTVYLYLTLAGLVGQLSVKNIPK